MKITIKLFAFFRDNRFAEEVRAYHDQATVGSIVDELKIDRDDVGIIMINSKHCTFESSLTDGDILAIFPVVGGG